MQNARDIQEDLQEDAKLLALFYLHIFPLYWDIHTFEIISECRTLNLPPH